MMKKLPLFFGLFLTVSLSLVISDPANSENRVPAPRPKEASLSRLSSLPYLQVKSPTVKQTGVVKYEEESASPGVNLAVSLCPLRAFILDMKGNILHKWEIEAPEAWPELEDRWEDYNWRNVRLFPNGDLLAICPGMGLIKIDKNSNLLWSYTGDYIAHHDLDIDKDGNIFLLTHREIKDHPELKLTGPLLNDYITILSPDGKAEEHISIIDCFLNSDYAPLLDTMEKEGDAIHTNTLELIDGGQSPRIPFFKGGYVLIAIREFSTIAVIDPVEEKVVWALTGLWRWQHHPTILTGGNILLFDNCGLNAKRSRVMEFNPLTQEIEWDYRGKPGERFYSHYSGSCHRLANGNTLIIESDSGRALEVTPDKKIVWLFNNPFRGEPGEAGGSLYELIRIDPVDYPFLIKNLSPEVTIENNE